MGFLDKLFSGKKYPELSGETPAAQGLKAMNAPLEELTKEVSEAIEVVPADDSAYVFIGNPNKNFGMAWIEQGKVRNFQTLANEKGMSQQQLLQIQGKLQDAYHRSGDDKRFSTTIGGKQVVVTPSPSLAQEVKSIISST